MRVNKISSKYRGFPKYLIVVTFDDEEKARFKHIRDGLCRAYGKPDDFDLYRPNEDESDYVWGSAESSLKLYFQTESDWFDARNKYDY